MQEEAKLAVLKENPNAFEEQPENLGLTVPFTHAHVKKYLKAVLLLDEYGKSAQKETGEDD